MCVCGRVLFEVASLEREAALPHEACLRHLAASVRTCHKIHGFAGGFEQDQSELFDKARFHSSRLHARVCCADFGFLTSNVGRCLRGVVGTCAGAAPGKVLLACNGPFLDGG